MSPLLRRSREPQKVVGILGMHRSGTSWLAGSLQDLGLYLGRVRTKNSHNRKGNRENREINAIHDQVLAANGGTWREPSWPNEWSDAHRRQLLSHLKRMTRQSPMWGFKDPRTLLMLDEWRDHVPEMVRVGIFRHPLKVFKSLHARHSDFTEDEAVALWQAYNVRLLAEHEREPFPVMRFDVEQDKLWAGLTTLRDHIGLPADKPLDGFFEESLVHHAAPDQDVPPQVAEQWAALQRIAVNA